MRLRFPVESAVSASSGPEVAPVPVSRRTDQMFWVGASEARTIRPRADTDALKDTPANEASFAGPPAPRHGRGTRRTRYRVEPLMGSPSR